MERENDSLALLDWLLGEWRGYGIVGKDMNTIYKRFYYDLAQVFFVERTTAMFPPSKPTTEYEIHQDLLFYYLDEASGKIKTKGFYVEGYVSSANVEIAKNGDVITIESTLIENGPRGMAVRDTIMRQSEDEFKSTFEIARPGMDFKLSQKHTMKRMG